MSTIGSPIETSLLQTAQAQQVAARKKDRERAEVSERARRIADLVELRVAGVEDASAIRAVPPNDSEQAGEEHQAQSQRRSLSEDPPSRVDLKA